MNDTTSSTNQVPGQLIILNGTSSAGKSSIAKALQEKLSEVFLHVQMDTFWDMLPPSKNPHMLNIKAEMRYALPDVVGVFVNRGKNVILDIVCGQKTVELYQKYHPYLVAIKPELEVVKVREIGRGDREIGLAESQRSLVSEGILYDLEIDNSSLTVAQTADKIIEAYTQAKCSSTLPEAVRVRPETLSGIA